MNERIEIHAVLRQGYGPQPSLSLRDAKAGAQGGTRTPTPYGTRPSNVCVYQFHHLSISNKGNAE